MPASMHKISAMADTVSQRLGIGYKGTRSWRRLICNAPLSNLLGQGEFEKLPGVLAILSRIGAWSNPDMVRSTCWEIYTSTVTDMQAADITRVCSGRNPTSDHRLHVRTAGLASFMSKVQGWNNSEGNGSESKLFLVVAMAQILAKRGCQQVAFLSWICSEMFGLGHWPECAHLHRKNWTLISCHILRTLHQYCRRHGGVALELHILTCEVKSLMVLHGSVR
jgi:hypothetical protein